MENKWEYDYSGIYQNPTPPAGGPAYQQPAGPGPMGPIGPDLSGQQPPMPAPKKGRGKKAALAVAAVLLVGAVSFGGGFAGYTLASKADRRVVYQSVQPSPISNADDGSLANGLVNVAGAVSPSVVVVTTDKLVTDGSFWGVPRVASGAGSGVIYTQDGYIITNNHVIEGAQKISVKLNDGTEYPAALVGTDPQTDVAVIKVEADDLVPAVLGDSDTVQVGETVVAVGNPMGTLGGTVTNGIISAINRSITVQGQEMSLMQTNAAVSPGNSGGGLFNASGELIGIVNAKSAGENAEGLGFAIPVNTARQVAQDLMEHGYVTGRPVLGVVVRNILDPQTAMQYGVSSMGVYVQEVVPGSGADNAGVKVGDRVLAVNGKMIEASGDVLNALSTLSAGDTVEMQLAREQKILTVSVVLGEKPAER